MIAFRTTAEPSKNLYLAIERMSDGQFFDWSIGAFSTKPTAVFQSLIQDPTLPGRYATTAPHQQLNQFPVGTSICFWMFRATGDTTPSKTATWMESDTVEAIPYNFVTSASCAIINEPASAF